MALMTYEEVRRCLLNETPTQFCVNVELLEGRMEEKGFSSLKECLTAPVSKGGCGLESSKIKDMLYFNPMYKHKADKLAIKLQLDCVEPLKPIGGNNNPEGKNQHSKELGRVDNINLSKPKKNQGGTSSDYLLAKIKRDRPDIAQRLSDGEFKSVRHAALEAGMVRQKFQIEPTQQAVIEFIERHNVEMSPQGIIELIDLLNIDMSAFIGFFSKSKTRSNVEKFGGG